MRIVSIVGARPEFIQAYPLSLALAARHVEILIHTGQHYDYLMSQTFFDQLEVRPPDFNLEVGSGSQSQQTAEILIRLERVLTHVKPDLVIVRGDTNSTLAGALVASKLGIPLAHVEAGERSFNRSMPEEINRLVADSVADLFFCASRTAVRQLEMEGKTEGVYFVGDIMLDAFQLQLPRARHHSKVLEKNGLRPKDYALVTIHRAGNTDHPDRLRNIIACLNTVREPVVFPAHPRTRRALEAIGAKFGPHVRLIEPVGYLDMLALEHGARLIATDSGGVQREAYFLGIPCLTLREETEWLETVAAGWNRLVGVEPPRVLKAWHSFVPPAERPPIFGDGSAAAQIAGILAGMETALLGSKEGRSRTDTLGSRVAEVVK